MASSIRQRYRERPGLGDAIVILALVLLVGMIVWPIRRGTELGRREESTRKVLEDLSRAARSSGLLEAFRRLDELVAADPDIEAFTRYYLGRVAIRALPTWEDNAYFYRLRLDVDAATEGGVLVDALPRKPGSSGRVEFHASGGGNVSESPVLVDRVLTEIDVDKNEERASTRAALLATRVVAAGVPSALAVFRRTWLGHGDEIESDEGYPELVRENYRMRAWPIFESGHESGRMVLEILAWPHELGSTGFAAFRVAGTAAVLQSRNLVRPYDAVTRRNVPGPGAGLPRTKSHEHDRSYLGVDGNHWFHAKTHAAR